MVFMALEEMGQKGARIRDPDETTELPGGSPFVAAAVEVAGQEDGEPMSLLKQSGDEEVSVEADEDAVDSSEVVLPVVEAVIVEVLLLEDGMSVTVRQE